MPRDPKDFAKKLADEIDGGLQNSAKLRDAARKNYEFYSMQFDKHRVQNRDGRYQTDAIERYSPILRRIADVLCGSLYKSDPRRILSDGIATELLAKIYKRQRMQAKWKRADAMTFVGGFQAFQFAGGESLESPVVITQWQPHELVVWTDPDDATEAAAVATIEYYDGGARLKLWTRETLTTYERKKGKEEDHVAFSSRRWEQVSKVDNPYRSVVVQDEETGEEEEGLIPFTFAHWNYPCSFFDTTSPGDTICQFNEHVNRRLTMLGDAIEYQSIPILLLEAVAEGFKFPAKLKPGDSLEVPSAGVDVAGNGIPPRASYLQPPLGHIEDNWTELNNAISHMLEMHGVPESAIRMVQSGAASGLAIQSEQLPLLTWTEGRRGDWQSYEEDAARMALLVAQSHTRARGVASEADRIQGMLDDWEFSVQWPNLFTQLPGPQKDQSDEWRLEQGIANKVTVLMERNGFTEDEALDYLAKLKEQDAKLMAMGIDPKPAAPPQANPFGKPQPGDVMSGEGRPPGQQYQPNPQPPPQQVFPR